MEIMIMKQQIENLIKSKKIKNRKRAFYVDGSGLVLIKIMFDEKVRLFKCEDLGQNISGKNREVTFLEYSGCVEITLNDYTKILTKQEKLLSQIIEWLKGFK